MEEDSELRLDEGYEISLGGLKNESSMVLIEGSGGGGGKLAGKRSWTEVSRGRTN